MAMEVGLSIQTIKRWYKWWENDQFEKPEGAYLPPYYYKDRRKTKWFNKDDAQHLITFNEKLKKEYKGCMSDFNAVYQWGRRGTRALHSKGMTRREVVEKMKKGEQKDVDTGEIQ